MSDDGDDRTRSSEDDMVDTIGGSVDSRADDVVSRPSMAPSLNRPPSAPPGQTGGGRAKNSPTDLSGLKTNTIDVNPYLKGQLVRDPHGDHVFKGRWSMRFADFEPGPGPMSDFELKHKSMDPEESDMFPFSGSYTGWYKMKETAHGSKETRVEEKDVMIVFKKNSGPDSYNVDGFGRNQFGQYKIVGLLSRATQGNGTLELFRIYVPGAPGTAPPPPPVSQPQGSNRPRAPSRPSEGAAPKLKSSGSGSKLSGGGGGGAKAKQPAAQAAGAAAVSKKKSPGGSHTPSLSTSGGGVPGKTLSEKNTRRCLNMVKELREKNKEACAWFLVPVDERMAPGYSAVIKQPMDFGTIETKLKSKPPQYSTVQEVAADVRLIFKNSMTFNGPDTPYYQDAETLNRAFNEIYKRVCAELKIAYDDGTGVVTTTAKATPKKKQPESVGPRPPPAPQYQLPTAHMADADMYSNPMVDQYRKKVHELSAQVVELESENSMLKLKLQQAENRNRLLEEQLGIPTAPPPALGVHHSHSHGHSHAVHSHHAHSTTSVHAGSTAPAGRNSPQPRAAPAPPPAPAVPVATAADRSRLEELIGAISESEDSNLMSDLCGVLEQYGVGLNADGELLIDVNGFDGHTVRALLDWCEPYFVNDQESAGEQSGSAGHQEKEDEHQPMEDQNTEETEEMAMEESTGAENGHVVTKDEGDGEEEAGEPMGGDSEPAAVTGVKRGRPADLDMDDTANKKVRAEAEEEPEVEPESETVKAAEPTPGLEGGATQAAPTGELVNGMGEEEEEDDVGLQEDGEEEDSSPAAGAQAPVNALNKWLSSGGDGDDDDEGAAEEAKEPSGAGAGEGEGSELWEQARQMKQQELEREKERLEEELRRRAQEEEAERKRREAALEEQRRMEKERLEEEEKARKAKEEEEEKRRKKLEEARMQARMQRQQA